MPRERGAPRSLRCPKKTCAVPRGGSRRPGGACAAQPKSYCRLEDPPSDRRRHSRLRIETAGRSGQPRRDGTDDEASRLCPADRRVPATEHARRVLLLRSVARAERCAGRRPASSHFVEAFCSRARRALGSPGAFETNAASARRQAARSRPAAPSSAGAVSQRTAAPRGVHAPGDEQRWWRCCRRSSRPPKPRSPIARWAPCRWPWGTATWRHCASASTRPPKYVPTPTPASPATPTTIDRTR